MTLLERLSRLARLLDRWVSRLTLATSWAVLLLLLGTTLLAMLGRHVDLGVADLSEVGGRLFFAWVMLSFGFAYLRDGHVRVDLLRERMRPAWVAGLEIVGCVAILAPLSGLLIRHGLESAHLAFVQGERLAGLDLPAQWVIRAAVPLGFVWLLLAGLAVVIRNELFLLGREAHPAPTGKEPGGGHATRSERGAAREAR